MAEPVIRPARPADGRAVVEVIKGGFSERLVEMTVYGCPGAVAWIGHQLALPQGIAERRYTVAVVEGEVAGAVDLGRSGRSLFLNYVAISPAHRGQRVADRLLQGALTAAGDGWTAMTLDVLEDNARARAWYERLGFHPESVARWWRVPLPPAPGNVLGGVGGFPQAQACHAAFGFSQFEVVTSRGSYPVGRLGARWYRVTGPALLADQAAVAVLARLDPCRELLAILSGGDAPPEVRGAVPVAATHRLRADSHTLMDRIDAAIHRG